MSNINPCKDHLGKEYISTAAMCRAYNINQMTFRGRIKSGWNLEDALTSPPICETLKPCIAPDGKKYPSKAAMCRAYDMSYRVFSSRTACGHSLKDALEKPIRVYHKSNKHNQ